MITFGGVVHGECEQELFVAVPEIHYNEQAEYSCGGDDSLLGIQPMGLIASSWAVKPVFSSAKARRSNFSKGTYDNCILINPCSSKA